ncbi:hypothetical protein RIF29_31437 [Crotalaria pallida]|uniref:PGG domain-containing protein n=1 Tax=Crotalaria pallida TaxID=3830 RepID=A0AAN9EH79_CROPI
MVRRSRQNDLKTNWVKGQFKTFMVVSILLTTVTFAASFTLPGGVISSDDPDPHKRGMAVLVHKPMFQLFTISNTIAMYSSTAVCIVLMWMPSDDFRSAVIATHFATRLLGVALVTMGVAFLAALRLVVSEVSWLADIITIIGGIFLMVILFSNAFFMFPLAFDQPILRDFWSRYRFLEIWNLRTSIKVIAKK